VFIVKFEHYSNINDVLEFKGHDLFADDILEDELEEDDFHYSMLIGKKVFTEHNVYVGIVTSMY
jgi:16S rRNA processing protein RimM